MLPGMYRLWDGLSSQKNQGEWHSDGWEFFYLNSENNWVDVGWGAPHVREDLEPLIPGPRADQLW